MLCLALFFTGQVCCHCNHLASRPVGHTMQKSLKAKLQNAVNQVTSFAGADSPALIVGGRRRNRKKRKNKNGRVIVLFVEFHAHKNLTCDINMYFSVEKFR